MASVKNCMGKSWISGVSGGIAQRVIAESALIVDVSMGWRMYRIAWESYGFLVSVVDEHSASSQNLPDIATRLAMQR